MIYFRDGDGVVDTLDNCVAFPNSLQTDTDADGMGMCGRLNSKCKYPVIHCVMKIRKSFYQSQIM